MGFCSKFKFKYVLVYTARKIIVNAARRSVRSMCHYHALPSSIEARSIGRFLNILLNWLLVISSEGFQGFYQVCNRARGDTPRKFGWGCAARRWKPLPYFRPKCVIFPYPISDLTQNSITYFRPDPYPISFA